MLQEPRVIGKRQVVTAGTRDRVFLAARHMAGDAVPCLGARPSTNWPTLALASASALALTTSVFMARRQRLSFDERGLAAIGGEAASLRLRCANLQAAAFSCGLTSALSGGRLWAVRLNAWLGLAGKNADALMAERASVPSTHSAARRLATDERSAVQRVATEARR